MIELGFALVFKTRIYSKKMHGFTFMSVYSHVWLDVVYEYIHAQMCISLDLLMGNY